MLPLFVSSILEKLALDRVDAAKIPGGALAVPCGNQHIKN